MDVEIFWIRASLLALIIVVPSVAVGLLDPSMSTKKLATIVIPIIFAVAVKWTFVPTSPDWFTFTVSTVVPWGIGLLLFILFVNFGMVRRTQIVVKTNRMRA